MDDQVQHLLDFGLEGMGFGLDSGHGDSGRRHSWKQRDACKMGMPCAVSRRKNANGRPEAAVRIDGGAGSAQPADGAR